MNRLAVLAACLLAVAACKRAEAPAPAPASKPALPSLHDKAAFRMETDNLLNLVFGASVVDRDNEGHFEVSAAHAIDGTATTPWASAPGGELRGVFSLAAPSTLTRLGAAVAATQSTEKATLHFETSLDGTTWSKTIDVPLALTTGEPQFGNVSVDARYIRVSADIPGYEKSIASLYAVGRQIEAYRQPPLEGCWEINGQPARFTRNGVHVAGLIGNMAVVGGTDGQVWRLMWLDGPMWGYAAVSTGVDGQRLSGVRWHEEVNPKQNGDGWFGRRVPCASNMPLDHAKIVDTIIRRTGMWRIYGIDFNRGVMTADNAHALDLVARLVREHPAHRFRLVAREFHGPDEKENRARCQAKLDALRTALQARNTDLSRIEFVIAGTEISELNIPFTSQRSMDSAVDLQVVPR